MQNLIFVFFRICKSNQIFTLPIYQYFNKIIYQVMRNYSLVSYDQLRNSPTNTSSSKYSYMFSKQERFKLPPPNCPITAYNQPSQLSNRKTSLGFGNKYDFTKTSVLSPACNVYQAPTQFKKTHKKGKSFGVARELTSQFGIITKDILKFPGPGTYECKKDTMSTISFSMRPRTIDFIQKKITSKYNPGPGQYQHLEAFPKDGKAFISKFQTSKFAKIHHSPRFIVGKDSPSPLTYDVRNNFSHQGKYFLSNNRGSGTRAFNQTARNHFTDERAKLSITPGPGNYERISQFGLYGDSKYYKTLSGFQNKNNLTTK